MAGIRITDKPTRSTIDKIVGVREQGNTEVALIGVDDLAEQLLAGEIGQEIEGAASGLVQATSWPVLNGISGTRVGQPGRVPNQAGTHTDPVTSDTVNNQADYNWTGSAWTWTNDYVDFSAEIDTKLDNTTTALATLMGSAAGKTTPADNDSFAARDSADDFALTKFSWANIKETLDIDSKQDASANLDDWSDISANELFARPSVEEGAYLALLDDDGVGERFGTGGVFLADDGESIEVAAGWKIGRGDGDGDIIVFDPDTGIAAVLGKPNPDPIVDAGTGGTVAGNLFSDERNEYVEGRALAEALRLNSQDMSGFARRAPDAAAAKVLRIGTGQSFMKGSGQAHLMFTASRLALLAFSGVPAQTVGPDSRCVNVGATYVPFGGGSLTLTDLSEHFIYPTGTDNIYTETEALTGDYAVNASGGTPEAAREIVSWVLRNRWSMRADTASQSWKTVNMNHAKTDGSIAEVGEGDGLSRMYSLIDVFVSATTGTRLCDLIHMVHGQADEAAGTATYKADVETFYDNIWANLQLDLGQTDPPPMVMHQVGGPKYGTSSMVSANAQVDAMLDLTGASANIFLVGADYETPSFYFFDNSEFTGFPSDSVWDNNGHPVLAGNTLLGIRAGVAAHYIHDREEPYWIPFPYEAYYEGTDFLISIPSKFMPLRVTDMVCGVETVLLDNLGITFESSGGAENPVLWARVVPGYNTLIEGRCADTIGSYTTVKLGKRSGALTQSGFTNIRDSFDLSIPFDLPFDKAQTYFPLEGRDDPALNGLGRFLEDIPGWVGKPDLGNPCARRTLTAQSFPS